MRLKKKFLIMFLFLMLFGTFTVSAAENKSSGSGYEKYVSAIAADGGTLYDYAVVWRSSVDGGGYYVYTSDEPIAFSKHYNVNATRYYLVWGFQPGRYSKYFVDFSFKVKRIDVGSVDKVIPSTFGTENFLSDSVSDLIKASNFNIPELSGNMVTDTVFFSATDFSILPYIKEIPVQINPMVKVITIVAVSCLALLIGCLLLSRLFPRFLHF